MDRIVRVEVEGVVGVLMHRYIGEQPSQPKAPLGGKTTEFIEEQHKRDFLNSCYYNGKNHGFPATVIEAAVATSAKAFRKGIEFKRSVTVVEDWIPILVPHGSGWREVKDSPEELYQKKEYVFLTGVRLKTGRVDRCRPHFKNWRLRFTLFINESKLDMKPVRDAVEAMIVGDFRPRYGRSKLISFEVEEEPKTKAA